MSGTISSQKGIDIRDALEILSERSSEEHGHRENTGPGCGCHAPKDAKTMGQTIDMNEAEEQPESMEEESNDDNDKNDQDTKDQQEQLDKDRAKRRIEIEAHMQTMTLKELLHAVMDAQQNRVSTYKDYEKGLDALLETGNMTNYPYVCAAATSSFSVCSDTINIIQTVLKEPSRNRPDLQKLIGTLQTHEKEKLSLTAALHLDRIRESQHGGGDQRILTLIQDAVASLRTKIEACVEQINDALEEIRYAMVEEE